MASLETLEPQVVTVLEDRQKYDVLDPELRDDLVRLRGKTTGELGVVRSERTDRCGWSLTAIRRTD